MTHEAGRWQLPGNRHAAGRPQGADAGTGGGDEPPALDQLFDADSLYAVRAAAAAHAAHGGLPDGRVADLVLAVHELAANAVRHGAGRGRLRLWTTADRVRCEVSDDGPPSSRAAPDTASWNIDPGHGLWLVRRVADQTSVRSGPAGTIATVVFGSGRQPDDAA